MKIIHNTYKDELERERVREKEKEAMQFCRISFPFSSILNMSFFVLFLFLS